MTAKKSLSLVFVMVVLLTFITGSVPAVTAEAASVISPSGLKVTSDTNMKITLSWKKVSGADGYQIYRKSYATLIGPNVGYERVKTITSGNVLTWTDKVGNYRYVKYYYKIRAYKKSASGKIIYSSISKAVLAEHISVFDYMNFPSRIDHNSNTIGIVAHHTGVKVTVNIGSKTYTAVTGLAGILYINIGYHKAGEKWKVTFSYGKRSMVASGRVS